MAERDGMRNPSELASGFDDSFAEGKHCKEERRKRDFLEELLFAGLRKVNPTLKIRVLLPHLRR